ncbi:hypothetical protein [Limnoraphis robusta]|uniref:Uncharacterized protein n=2 Tax=Limnoraphis robusta CS-951 TaxID=1637645 RepID=A0A0F5YGD8_9CYAN|nr:hypothetical protein [Limnoraphis robusta]KKD37697.1 hypothetical protein WN50_12970 [Limnoraphis robusta CS-951]
MNNKFHRRNRTPKTPPQMVRILYRIGWLHPKPKGSETSAVAPIQQTSKPSRRRQRLPLPKNTILKAVWKKWMADGVAFALLLGGSTLLAGGAWFSYKLILDPDVGIWLNQFLPAWTQVPLQPHDAIKTLDQVGLSLEEQGLTIGESLSLPRSDSPQSSHALLENNPYLNFLKPFLLPPEKLVQNSPDLLVPVMKKREPSQVHPCPTVCQEIVELRVYKAVQIPYERPGSEPYYRLVHQLEANGPAESFVLASLISNRTNQQGSNKPLPLTRIRQFSGKAPSFGVWFSMGGERVIGQKNVPYGQVIHYNPTYYYLSTMLEWKSSAGQQPIWEQVTGNSEPELLIEETIGLEPQFNIYQVKPRRFVPNPIQLADISLDEQVIDNYDYRKALRLARSGLWSPALELMKPLKENVGKDDSYPAKWPAVAQAQLDLIQFHANITDAQAGASWASPTQKVLAGLIDGRWTEALDVVQNERVNSEQINTLLQADGGRLKTRIQAALVESPEEPDLQAWGALIVAAQEGRNQAIAWLDEQSLATSENKIRIQKLLD